MVAVVQADGEDARWIRERREQADFAELVARVCAGLIDGGDAGGDDGESVVIGCGEIDHRTALLRQHANRGTLLSATESSRTRGTAGNGEGNKLLNHLR
jgi:hypothetical protein